MADSQPSIVSLVQQLEEQLQQSDALPAEEKASLRHALEDVKAKLDPNRETEAAAQQAVEDASAEAEHHSLSDRLQSAMQNFESSHPDLAAALDRVITNLGQIGL